MREEGERRLRGTDKDCVLSLATSTPSTSLPVLHSSPFRVSCVYRGCAVVREHEQHANPQPPTDPDQREGREALASCRDASCQIWLRSRMGFELALPLQLSTHLGAAFTTGGGSFQYCWRISYQHVFKTGTAIAVMTEEMSTTSQLRSGIHTGMKLILVYSL